MIVEGTRFVLTSLERGVYETQKAIGVAMHNRWILQAIDLLEKSLVTHNIPNEEKLKIMNMLIEDCDRISGILLYPCSE